MRGRERKSSANRGEQVKGTGVGLPFVYPKWVGYPPTRQIKLFSTM